MAEIVMAPDWEHVLKDAAAPVFREFARNTLNYIVAEDGAPVQTGNLRDHTFSEYNEEDGSVEVGVELDAAPYAEQVILGTESRPANDYIGRSAARATEDLRL